jgi:hypothetical protein
MWTRRTSGVPTLPRRRAVGRTVGPAPVRRAAGPETAPAAVDRPPVDPAVGPVEARPRAVGPVTARPRVHMSPPVRAWRVLPRPRPMPVRWAPHRTSAGPTGRRQPPAPRARARLRLRARRPRPLGRCPVALRRLRSRVRDLVARFRRAPQPQAAAVARRLSAAVVAVRVVAPQATRVAVAVRAAVRPAAVRAAAVRAAAVRAVPVRAVPVRVAAVRVAVARVMPVVAVRVTRPVEVARPTPPGQMGRRRALVVVRRRAPRPPRAVGPRRVPRGRREGLPPARHPAVPVLAA